FGYQGDGVSAADALQIDPFAAESSPDASPSPEAAPSAPPSNPSQR
ncbi:MAG: hypothetical protein IGR76_12365, partial [Synechococcales cyanobacterium T60_A2020_003]|nr:hypothetical protein [Synechococcales cyanobacterium T60_A2020_003]